MHVRVGVLNNRPELNRGSHVVLRPGDHRVSVVESKGRIDGIAGETLSVVLAIRDENDCIEPEADLSLPMVRARLQFGSGGVMNDAICDWKQGTVLTVPCEGISVAADYDVEWFGVEPSSCAHAPCVRLSATISYGTRASSPSSATLTEVAVAAAGERARIRVPDFAESFTVIPIGDAAQTIVARVFGLGTLVWARYEVAGPLTNVGQHDTVAAFPLFNGARFVELTNAAPNIDTKALVVFRLAF